MKIIGISGSFRKSSHNTGLLRAIQTLLPEGNTLEIVEYEHLPPYNADVDAAGEPQTVTDFRHLLNGADAIIIASPEYNYSVPGMLKNMIDWMSRNSPKPFDGKPVMILGASNGNYGTVRMQNHLRTVLHSQNAMVLNKPEVLVNQAKTKFDEHGDLHDEATLAVIQKTLNLFISHARMINGSRVTIA